MVETAGRRMTLAEFLAWDDGTDTRYELVRGKLVAMAPPGAKHSVVVPNLGAALRAQLKAPCYVGMNAGVIRPDRDDTFYEAALVVSCTPLATDMPMIPQPVVVIEVLSPSTAEHDRGGKLYDYRRIASV
jgi:Uma2 family endonuclease